MTKRAPTFEDAFAELEQLTEWFETEEVDLDEGLKKYGRGLELADLCKKQLSLVENKITELKKTFSSTS